MSYTLRVDNWPSLFALDLSTGQWWWYSLLYVCVCVSCLGSFDLLIYTDKDLEVPEKWGESGPALISSSEEVRLRSFTTTIHTVDSMVSYKNTNQWRLLLASRRTSSVWLWPARVTVNCWEFYKCFLVVVIYRPKIFVIIFVCIMCQFVRSVQPVSSECTQKKDFRLIYVKLC